MSSRNPHPPSHPASPRRSTPYVHQSRGVSTPHSNTKGQSNEKKKKSREELTQSIENLKEELAKKAASVKCEQDTLNAWINTRADNLADKKKAYHSATDEVQAINQKLLAAKKDEKCRKKEVDSMMKKYLSLKCKVAYSSIDIETARIRINRLQRTMNGEIDNEEQYMERIDEDKEGINQGDLISKNVDGTLHRIGASISKHAHTIESKREQLQQMLESFNILRQNASDEITQSAESLTKTREECRAHVNRWKATKENISNAFSDTDNRSHQKNEIDVTLATLQDGLSEKVKQAYNDIDALFVTVKMELERRARQVKDEYEEMNRLLEAARPFGQPAEKDLKELDSYLIADLIIGDDQPYSDAYDSNDNLSSSRAKKSASASSSFKVNNSSTLDRKHSLQEQLKSFPNFMKEACRLEGQKTQLLSQYKSLRSYNIHQASLLYLACQELDGTGLADAYWNRPAIMPTAEGHKPSLAPPKKVIQISPDTVSSQNNMNYDSSSASLNELDCNTDYIYLLLHEISNIDSLIRRLNEASVDERSHSAEHDSRYFATELSVSVLCQKIVDTFEHHGLDDMLDLTASATADRMNTSTVEAAVVGIARYASVKLPTHVVRSDVESYRQLLHNYCSIKAPLSSLDGW